MPTKNSLIYNGPGNSVVDAESDTTFPRGVPIPADQATIKRLTETDPATRGEQWSVVDYDDADAQSLFDTQAPVVEGTALAAARAAETAKATKSGKD